MGKCNHQRLQQNLELFSTYGSTLNQGVTRLSLSQEDIQARLKFKEMCEQLGLTVIIDDMATMYATLPGKKPLPPIVIGSHLDSVVKGGRFDGVLGVLTALEVVQSIQDQNLHLDYPITIVNFTNEEGARFEPSMMASGVLSNKFDRDKMLQSTDKNGETFEGALEKSGFKGSEVNRLKEALAYIELHIEQGPILEHLGRDIGVVEGVLGMVCYEISLHGESNHAGTTPINMRKDAMFATSNVIVELQKQLKELDDELVYTIGRINAYPNVHTVIPNQVTFTLESRHKDPAVIKQVENIIKNLPDEHQHCHLTYEKLWDRDTVVFKENVCSVIAESCENLGYSAHHMYSGAGHDAQFIASYIPSAMIFVPSKKGYSHREDEYTSYEECGKGADVMLHAVLQLAKQHVGEESSNLELTNSNS